MNSEQVSAATPGQAEAEREVLRSAFAGFLASQGYDEQGRFDQDEMELAFETGWQIAQAAPAAQPTGAAISAWIENYPREFATWLATQRHVGGVTPESADLAAQDARPAWLESLLEEWETDAASADARAAEPAGTYAQSRAELRTEAETIRERADHLREAANEHAAQDARPAPASASQVRRHGAQAASDLADDFYFERKQVVALRAVLGEVFTCLAAGDPALLDDEQVAEWRERAGMEES